MTRSDWRYNELTGDSAHLAPYRRAVAPGPDVLVEQAMLEVRTLARRGRAAREEAAITVHQPRLGVVCVVPQQVAGDGAARFDLLEAEVKAKPNVRALGKRFGKEADGRFAAIDLSVTQELRRERIARELVSQLQRLRRDLGFAVSDRIRLWISAPDDVQAAITAHTDSVANELLAREIAFGELPVGHQASHEIVLDGSLVRVALTREP